MRGRRAGAREIALALTTVIWLVALHRGPLSEGVITDVPLYRETAAMVWDGAVPYRDFALEYPPLAAALITLAGLPGLRYGVVFSALMLACLLVVIVAADGIARHLGLGGARRIAVLATLTLSPLALGGLMETRYDLALAAVLALTVWSALAGRTVLAWVLLAVGVLLKLSPLLLVPVLVLHLRGRGENGLRGPLAGAAVVAAGFLPFLVVAPGGIADMLRFHLERPLQIESTVAAYLLSLHALADIPLEVVSSYGSQGLAGPGVTLLTAVSSAALVVLVGAVAVQHGLLLRDDPGDRDRDRLFVAAITATLLAAMAAAKVFSPQFMIWLLPMVLLVAGRYGRTTFALGVAAAVMTAAYFPYRYWDLVALETLPIALLAARDGLVLAALAAAWPRRPATTEAAVRPPGRTTRSPGPGPPRRM